MFDLYGMLSTDYEVLTFHGDTDDIGREFFLTSLNSETRRYSVGIMTFRAGGVGLSITRPNHVIINV